MERSDAELLAASRRGEREAFGALVERYQGVVCAVTYSRTGDRALSEDVAQDTFIAAWSQLDRVREVGKLRGWLCAIARNLARKARRRASMTEPLDRPMVFEGANPFDATAAAESERVVREALGRVPETYRDALVLFYRDQRSARDVAVALGITEAAALQRLARGRQYLADGVTDLVESSLRDPRKWRSGRALAAGVLAALPFVVPSRVHASPTHGGSRMLKLALVGAAVAAAGTTAYVVHAHGSSAPAAIAAPAPAPSRAAAPPPTFAGPHDHAARTGRVDLRAPAPVANAELGAPADPPEPVYDRATQDRLAVGPAHGAATAPVTIVEFTDFQCPFCGKAVGAIDQLVEEFPGKLRVVSRQLPVHQTAKLAAEGAFAADAEGKYWEYHDAVFAHEGEGLSRDQLVQLAQASGLDGAAFGAALDAHAYAAQLDADSQLAQDLEIAATPTFIINGKRITGMRDIDTMRQYVRDALAAAQP